MNRVANATATANGAGRLDASYEELRRLIVDGELAPGTRILGAEIAQQLGVSRRTAQAALERLFREGLINRPGGNRAPRMVITLTIRGFREIVDVMVAIHCLAARRAAELDSANRQKVVDELRVINDEFRAVGAVDQPDPKCAEELDWHFHGHLVRAVVGNRLYDIYTAQQPTVEVYGRNYMSHLIDTTPASAEEHAEVIDAIEAGDADTADLATRTNWANACERYAEIIKDVGEQGVW
jgi:DNA-binding GntR family transcriptional regulator